MDPEPVEQVRRFNRVVTQRVGALENSFLSRNRPLGQARVLWEIGAAEPRGADGTEPGTWVRTLRARLDLDSGYLSRLLRALEADGLVVVDADPGDGRVRTARLTAAGRAERTELDRRSADLAAAVLAPLTARQRGRLVAAMAEVERLITASMVRIAATDPRQPAARHCLRAYFAELADRFNGGFDLRLSIPAAEADLALPAGLFLVATLHDEPVGCGALRFHDTAPAEVKRMWVAPAVRGLGLGRRLLAELEERARAHGARTLRLETNGTLTEAVGMYRAAGYREVPAFNDEPYAHHWFEKAVPEKDGPTGTST